MLQTLSKMYETLTEQQQQEVYNFVFSIYMQNSHGEENKDENFGFGSLKKYANPNLRKYEKEAWATVAEEKHGLLGR